MRLFVGQGSFFKEATQHSKPDIKNANVKTCLVSTQDTHVEYIEWWVKEKESRACSGWFLEIDQ